MGAIWSKSSHHGKISLMWILYTITASIFWGIDYTLTGEVLKSIRFSTLLSIELFIGFLGMLGITIVSGAYQTVNGGRKV